MCVYRLHFINHLRKITKLHVMLNYAKELGI